MVFLDSNLTRVQGHNYISIYLYIYIVQLDLLLTNNQIIRILWNDVISYKYSLTGKNLYNCKVGTNHKLLVFLGITFLTFPKLQFSVLGG